MTLDSYHCSLFKIKDQIILYSMCFIVKLEDWHLEDSNSGQPCNVNFWRQIKLATWTCHYYFICT